MYYLITGIFYVCTIPHFFIDCHLQAIVVFIISIHSYAYDKSEMEEVSMVALSGCIWLQAFVITMETK
jgi:hypothetical protein